LRGKTAISLAKVAYALYREKFHGLDFETPRRAGGRPQPLLWASTGTKNPAYSDVLYVESLIGPDTVTTLPDATLRAFRDHGRVALTLKEGLQQAQIHLTQLREMGIDVETEVGAELQKGGLQSFVKAFDGLLEIVG
jgi:transaldolase